MMHVKEMMQDKDLTYINVKSRLMIKITKLDDIKPKIIISKDVVFNESLMYNNTLKGASVAYSEKEVEFEVKLQGSRVEPTMDPHNRENPGNDDEEQDEGAQQHNLDNYVLVRVKL
nr:hypothetical protein [Tanacetum cinerariifolium]